MNTNPKWWNREHETRWERVKSAFRRDWDQTKHDLGGDAPDLNQNVDDTLKQAAGKQPIPRPGEPTYEDIEPAYRFGYGARRQFAQHSMWNEELESSLKREWGTTYPDRDWMRYRDFVRRGWAYEENPQDQRKAA
jgi:hypothetical protein